MNIIRIIGIVFLFCALCTSVFAMDSSSRGIGAINGKSTEQVGGNNVAGIEMVSIPGGSFQMGSNDGYDDEKPVHRVYVKGFKMGKYEVTQSQWKSVMGSNPSGFKGANKPVENVSWNDVQIFLRKLNARTGQRFRLSSEAEWEYAARAGTSSPWRWGNREDSADVYAWYAANSGGKSHATGLKRANGYGLYDMHGNVNEWVEDCYYGSYSGASEHAEARESASCLRRVFRGASWINKLHLMRTANRGWGDANMHSSLVGFRLVMD